MNGEIMKKLLIGLTFFTSLSCFANIDYSIQEFEKVMSEAKTQIGMGYSIESISRVYSAQRGHGFKMILNKLLGAKNRKCYVTYPKSFGPTSKLKFSPCE